VRVVVAGAPVNRCKICIYPDTRPDAHFVDGICSACRAFPLRAKINWDVRLDALEGLVCEAKARKAPYDVVVPVSGGKDSTAQVLKLIELGAKVLAVNGATDMMTPIGRRNLDNLKRFCDVIEVTPNIEVRKTLVRAGLYQVGDMSWPEHNIIWAAPTRMAALMGIPLVVWGEQPQREYSTPEGVEPATNLDAAWVAQFGGMGGLRLNDLIDLGWLTAADIEVYRFPPAEMLERANVRGIWLSDYIDWDGWKNAFIAQHYGFEMSSAPVETSLGGYENLDNYVTVLRDFLRFVKFGYTRGTDIACNHIRRGRLTREEGLALEAKTFGFPWTSLGKPIEEVLAYFGITLEQYIDECRRWMNPEIFSGFDGKFNPVFRKANGSGDAHHTSLAQ
jgi:N-acetyl sugar amidotransferase